MGTLHAHLWCMGRPPPRCFPATPPQFFFSSALLSLWTLVTASAGPAFPAARCVHSSSVWAPGLRQWCKHRPPGLGSHNLDLWRLCTWARRAELLPASLQRQG